MSSTSTSWTIQPLSSAGTGVSTATGDVTIGGDLTVEGGLITHKQLGGNDYHPGFQLYNYDANNDDDQGFSTINFFNSKSDTETDVATDDDAHLGRLLWHGNAGGSDGSKYAGSVNSLQCAAWGSGDYVGCELQFVANARQDGTAAVNRKFSWAPPATPAADNLPSLIINGTSSDITQSSANQLYIKNGKAPGTVMDTYIAIGSKNIGGNTALELTQEEAVATEAIAAADRSVKITINGSTYKLMLEAV
jgi:hypothetical protein